MSVIALLREGTFGVLPEHFMVKESQVQKIFRWSFKLPLRSFAHSRDHRRHLISAANILTNLMLYVVERLRNMKQAVRNLPHNTDESVDQWFQRLRRCSSRDRRATEISEPVLLASESLKRNSFLETVLENLFTFLTPTQDWSCDITSVEVNILNRTVQPMNPIVRRVRCLQLHGI